MNGFESMKKERETEYNITVRYRGGGEGIYYDTKIVSCKDGILEIMISSSKTICIVINGLSWWTVDKKEVK